MRRKVALIGPSTLMVSLPSKWVMQNKIKKGDELDIYEEGSRLIINCGKVDGSKKISIDLNKNPSLIRRYLMDAYRSGFDEIRIEYKNPDDIEVIQKTSNEILTAFEIIEQGKNHCLLKSITKDSFDEFQNLLSRLFLVTSLMAKNVHDALKNSDNQLLKEALVLEVTNNRIALYCERLLSKKGFENYAATNFTFTIIYTLEKIADELKYISEYAGSKKLKIASETIKSLSKIIEMLELNQKIYFNLTNDSAEKLTTIKDELTAPLPKT